MLDDNQTTQQSRRSFLSIIPLGVFAGVFTSIGVVAFRFLRPRITGPATTEWTDVASVSELSGALPIPKTMITQRLNGWALTNEEHRVFVLPDHNNQVLSAVCPHEGCEVAWENNANRFSCPCHESYFAADGSRLNGPARRGLDALPSRIQNGKLQVVFQSFENNATEQIIKA